MIKAILIDLGKTVLTNRVIDFTRGLKAIYDLDERPGKIDFSEYLRLYRALRKISFDCAREINSEVKISTFLETLNEVSGINADCSGDELEWVFQSNFIEEELIDGVVLFLEYCESINLPVIAVSNSCITSYSLKRELDDFKVLKYFKDVISSADILVRKPRKEIFDFAYGKLLKLDSSIKKDEILFIGNDYNCDVVGSKNAGMTPVWFNEKHLEVDDNSFSFINVGSYLELIKVLKIMK